MQTQGKTLVMSDPEAETGEQQRLDFDALTRRLGLTIPKDSEARLFQGYRQLVALVRLMRPQVATDEPAVIFSALGQERGEGDV